MGRHRGLTAAGFGAGLLSLAGASVAWACVYIQPTAYLTAPGQAAASEQINVTAHNMHALTAGAPDPIQIVWQTGDQKSSSVVMTVPYADTFTFPMQVPADALDGHSYYIGAWDTIQKTYATPASLTIHNPVVQPGGTTAGPDTNTQSLGPAPAPTAAPVAPPAPLPNDSGHVSTDRAPVQTSGSSSGSNDGPGSGGLGSNSGRGNGPGASGAASADNSAVPIPGAFSQAAGGNVPANQVLGDLWGGFARGKTTSQAPSLLTTDSGPGAGLAIGLLAGGAVAIFAGFGIAELRRSRATAATEATIE